MNICDTFQIVVGSEWPCSPRPSSGWSPPLYGLPPTRWTSRGSPWGSWRGWTATSSSWPTTATMSRPSKEKLRKVSWRRERSWRGRRLTLAGWPNPFWGSPKANLSLIQLKNLTSFGMQSGSTVGARGWKTQVCWRPSTSMLKRRPLPSRQLRQSNSAVLKRRQP